MTVLTKGVPIAHCANSAQARSRLPPPLARCRATNPPRGPVHKMSQTYQLAKGAAQPQNLHNLKIHLERSLAQLITTPSANYHEQDV
jgi:hypothetical protein